MKLKTALIFIVFDVFLSLSACKTSNEVQITKDSARNNYVALGFMQSAILFSLDMRMAESSKYLSILKDARDRFALVSVSVFAGTNDIASVELAPEQVSVQFRKSLTKELLKAQFNALVL